MLQLKRKFEQFDWASLARFIKPVFVATWLICFPKLALAQQPGQKTFPSAEEATSSFYAAAKNDNERALLDIVGPAGKEVILSGDPEEDLESRVGFVVKYEEMHRIAKEPDGTMTLYVGAENWPLPIPLVNKNGAWYFDTDAGRQEIVFRRIGKNELTAIQACYELVDAQKNYYAKAPQGGSAKQYAQRFVSDEGKHNGLYWWGADDEFDSPLDPQIAAAGKDDSQNKQSEDAMPFSGYYFRFLTSQGRNASGGAKSYFLNSSMTRGFAIVAYPAEYGSSGITTFMVDESGTIYEKDLGPNTTKLAEAMTAYDPDSTWHQAE
ncbi:MAG: hypothetical protein JWN63_206 [Candidatus Acidoferrum typicum]|nr:hypothetical protein [Candidatus Acidoferrum typicum]